MSLSTNPRAVASREYRKNHPDKMREYAKRRKPLTDEQREIYRQRSNEYYQKLKEDPERLAAHNKKRRDNYLYKKYGIKRNGTTNN